MTRVIFVVHSDRAGAERSWLLRSRFVEAEVPVANVDVLHIIIHIDGDAVVLETDGKQMEGMMRCLRSTTKLNSKVRDCMNAEECWLGEISSAPLVVYM